MSMSSISKYIYILTFSLLMLCCPHPLLAQSNTDTTAADTTEEEVKSPDATSHQLALSFDVTQPFINHYSSYREGYEFALDYYLHKELYLVLEGGWGSAHVNYTDLAYNSKNSYYAFGINKSLISRLVPNDWDMVFMGVRLAAAPIERTAGTYTVVDSFWGRSSSIWMTLHPWKRIASPSCACAFFRRFSRSVLRQILVETRTDCLCSGGL